MLDLSVEDFVDYLVDGCGWRAEFDELRQRVGLIEVKEEGQGQQDHQKARDEGDHKGGTVLNSLVEEEEEEEDEKGKAGASTVATNTTTAAAVRMRKALDRLKAEMPAAVWASENLSDARGDYKHATYEVADAVARHAAAMTAAMTAPAAAAAAVGSGSPPSSSLREKAGQQEGGKKRLGRETVEETVVIVLDAGPGLLGAALADAALRGVDRVVLADERYFRRDRSQGISLDHLEKYSTATPLTAKRAGVASGRAAAASTLLTQLGLTAEKSNVILVSAAAIGSSVSRDGGAGSCGGGGQSESGDAGSKGGGAEGNADGPVDAEMRRGRKRTTTKAAGLGGQAVLRALQVYEKMPAVRCALVAATLGGPPDGIKVHASKKMLYVPTSRYSFSAVEVLGGGCAGRGGRGGRGGRRGGGGGGDRAKQAATEDAALQDREWQRHIRSAARAISRGTGRWEDAASFDDSTGAAGSGAKGGNDAYDGSQLAIDVTRRQHHGGGDGAFGGRAGANRRADGRGESSTAETVVLPPVVLTIALQIELMWADIVSRLEASGAVGDASEQALWDGSSRVCVRRSEASRFVRGG